jgi:hypothetical protein
MTVTTNLVILEENMFICGKALVVSRGQGQRKTVWAPNPGIDQWQVFELVSLVCDVMHRSGASGHGNEPCS